MIGLKEAYLSPQFWIARTRQPNRVLLTPAAIEAQNGNMMRVDPSMHALRALTHRGPVKREGDARSPAGAFAIGEAFGYETTAITTLPYSPMQASDYCVDVSGSPLYNQIVDAQVVGAAAVAKATEPMRRDIHSDGDQRYRLGFVIEHNTQAKPMAGSCIFAHLRKSPTIPTSGCTAMDPTTMDQVLPWLRPDQHPVFVLLPASEYTRLETAWRLPVVEESR